VGLSLGLGGDVSSFVSPRVSAHLAKRFALEAGNGDNGKQVQTLKQ